MKKVLMTVATVFTLVFASTAPAFAAQSGSETASVSVTAYVSGTIHDIGTNGLTFGSIVAGVNNTAEAEQTTAASVGGTHTGAADQATALTDSAGLFTTTDDVHAGMVITNDTDGSAGTVVSVDSATTITTSALTGGTENDWDTSDAYTIYGGAIIFESAPENNATTKYAIKSADAAFRSDRLDGTHTASDDETTTLTDTAATFQTDLVTTGMEIYNVTDGSTWAITAIPTETTITLGSHDSGGTDNDFDTDDVYAIYSESFAVSNLTWDDDTTIAGDASVTESFVQVGGDVTAGNPGYTNVGMWLDIPSSQPIDSYTISIDLKISDTV